MILEDGLYRVVTTYLVAGFVVKDNKIETCAPILKRHIGYWVRHCTWICK
jgi:hypothetical protein